jgi:pilus assembly protein CpaF
MSERQGGGLVRFRTGATAAAANKAAAEQQAAAAAPSKGGAREAQDPGRTTLKTELRDSLIEAVFQMVNMETATKMVYDRLVDQLEELIGQVATERRLQINRQEQTSLAMQIADDMLGIGPLEPLLKDDTITDIMVNGPTKVFVERKGKLTLTPITFRDENHLRNIASRIARNVGRRLDEATPMVDARLPDGSRVNIVIPPISIDGTAVSIRRFSKVEITLDMLVSFGALGEQMKQFLEIASEARLNILISGGTSSGKTTLLNALSRNIANNERIITIEDAAELRLQQPHVLRMETRPKTSESASEIGQRHLVANALRMRPDRIILGEVRGGEAFDLLQAMNTGHDGSLGTMHANTPRDALARLENMILMAGFELPMKAIRSQIASAVNLIIQAERMVDGQRRISRITEITGLENDVITTQDLFYFNARDNKQGMIRGEYVCNNVNLRCMDKLHRFGLAAEARRILTQ